MAKKSDVKPTAPARSREERGKSIIVAFDYEHS